ncbi:MAG: helix-turn-helix transcriptional regulator [Deltaproteobacteria bacterium]|nr:helix-turn-helix transcriptional regulator [Deltaproteobacteria bacterium]
MEKRAYLNVKDVSDLLDINEKKVYVLAQEGKIPGTKITGKWLFPAEDLEAIIKGKARETSGRFFIELVMKNRVILIAGSHDPIMSTLEGEFHEKNPQYAIFSSNVGSWEGLRLLKDGFCHIAFSHLFDPSSGDYNFPFIDDIFDDQRELVVINLFCRTIGFVSSKKMVASMTDIAKDKMRFINRQQGAGSRERVNAMIRSEGLTAEDIIGYDRVVYSHHQVINAIETGEADAGIVVESALPGRALFFHPISDERFDMIVQKKNYFEKNVQSLVEFIRSSAFAHILASQKGYDGRQTGKIMYPRSEERREK